MVQPERTVLAFKVIVLISPSVLLNRLQVLLSSDAPSNSWTFRPEPGGIIRILNNHEQTGVRIVFCVSDMLLVDSGFDLILDDSLLQTPGSLLLEVHAVSDPRLLIQLPLPDLQLN